MASLLLSQLHIEENSSSHLLSHRLGGIITITGVETTLKEATLHLLAKDISPQPVQSLIPFGLP